MSLIARSAISLLASDSGNTVVFRRDPHLKRRTFVSRHILVVLSEHGYWGEELLGPLTMFDERGYEATFATPTGKRPRALPPSLDASYLDPPLGRSVTTEDVARRARELDDSTRLDNPVSLGDWIPDRPY